jgi:RNA polymerase sigma-70 factor (ECF subfamily)
MTRWQLQRSDDSLMAERAAHGDREAFDRLMDRYSGRAYAVAAEWCQDRSQVPDVVVEAFTRAYRAIGSFRGEACFSTWFHRIVINCAHDANRHVAGRHEIHFDDGINVDLDKRLIVATDRVEGEESARQARWQRLINAVERLSDEKRLLFIESYVARIPYAQLAERHHLAVGTIKSRLFRIREELRARVLLR